jgi:hypothetical protein
MALQLPQSLLTQVSNFGQQPMQNLQQGLLTPVQIATQQPAGIGAIVSGLGGMFGIDTRSPQQLQAEKLKMAELEQFGQDAQKRAYAASQAVKLGQVGEGATQAQREDAMRTAELSRELIKQRDLGLITDEELLGKVELVKSSKREVALNATLSEYQKSVAAGNTERAESIKRNLINAGVPLADIDARREQAMKSLPKAAPPTLLSELRTLATSGDMVAQSYLETLSSGELGATQINNALSYLNSQSKPKNVAYLNPESFNSVEGLTQARQTALQNGDVAIAAQLGTLREELVANKVDLNAGQVVELASALNPNYNEIRERQLSLSQAQALLDIGQGAGVSELIIRSVSDIQRSDAKALAAMEKFTKSASIDQRIRASLSMFIRGKLDDATKEDYRNIAKSLNEFYTSELDNTAMQLLQSPNAEDQAAGAALLGYNSDKGGIVFYD